MFFKRFFMSSFVLTTFSYTPFSHAGMHDTEILRNITKVHSHQNTEELVETLEQLAPHAINSPHPNEDFAQKDVDHNNIRRAMYAGSTNIIQNGMPRLGVSLLATVAMDQTIPDYFLGLILFLNQGKVIHFKNGKPMREQEEAFEEANRSTNCSELTDALYWCDACIKRKVEQPTPRNDRKKLKDRVLCVLEEIYLENLERYVANLRTHFPNSEWTVYADGDRQVLSSSTSLENFFDIETRNIYDLTFLYLTRMCGWEKGHNLDIIKELAQNENHLRFSVALKAMYAWALIWEGGFFRFAFQQEVSFKKNDNHHRIIELLQETLTVCADHPSLAFRTSYFFAQMLGYLGNVYTTSGEYQKALHFFDEARSHDAISKHVPDYMFMKVLACFQGECFEEAFATLLDLEQYSDTQLNNGHIRRSAIEKFKLIATERLGRNSDDLAKALANKFRNLKERIEKEKEKEKKRKEDMAQFMASRNQELRQAQERRPAPKRKKPRPKVKGTGTSRYPTSDTHSQHTNYKVEVVQKTKKKTRGIPTPQPTLQEPSPISLTPENTVQLEGIVKMNSAHYDTIRKIFKEDAEKQEKISMHEIFSLMDQLDQTYSKSSGKGSHTKITMDFTPRGVEEDRFILILTKGTYLKPYQIKQLREAFTKFGLQPKHIRERE